MKANGNGHSISERNERKSGAGRSHQSSAALRLREDRLHGRPRQARSYPLFRAPRSASAVAGVGERLGANVSGGEPALVSLPQVEPGASAGSAAPGPPGGVFDLA